MSNNETSQAEDDAFAEFTIAVARVVDAEITKHKMEFNDNLLRRCLNWMIRYAEDIRNDA